MKKMRQALIVMVGLFALLFSMGCPQEANNTEAKTTPSVLVSAISIGGIAVNPLPAAAAKMGDAIAGTIVIDTMRSPLENEDPTNVYYKPVQTVKVTLANANETAFFAVSEPGEYPVGIELPGTPESGKPASINRNLSITSLDDNSFPVGQTIWVKVISADESKTEFYKISVISRTHDTALNSIAVNGNEVLDPGQSRHNGTWIFDKKDAKNDTWATSASALVNISNSQAANVTVTATARCSQYEDARAVMAYAKIPSGADDAIEPGWNANAPTSLSNNDILAVKVTASNGKTAGYLKISVKVGGSAFLSSLTVNNNSILLGNPNSTIAAVEGAYRVAEGQTLTDSAVQWDIAAETVDPGAAVSWALVAKGAIPVDSSFSADSPADFDTSHNYLYLKVVSQSEETTMYYLVIYDERPKDTEHIKVAYKNLPIYKFTIPGDKTWADLGDHPVIKARLYLDNTEWARTDEFRWIVFGELQVCNPSWTGTNLTNFNYTMGGSGFDKYEMYDRRAAPGNGDLYPDIDSNAAASTWFTYTYQLTELPDDKNTTGSDINSQPDSYIQQNDGKGYYPAAEKTGDVYFAVGITAEALHEYYVKELSLESADGMVKIPCNLLGDGRINSSASYNGFLHIGNNTNHVRELVADPALK